ncbi:MAG: DNA-processing protein DprA [Alphaproteobacteria bacterium]|nr:DNA-processing protein DprA [Alphaproteobacteria bacterium]MCL2890140.1 DNA-processing protein DprA [Alphaproteobacteria bacterium]
MNNQELFHKLLILRMPRVGPVRYAELINKFGSAAAASESLAAAASHIDSVRREMDNAARMGIIYISDDSDDYPANLRSVKNHPPVISVRGNIAALRMSMVGMVGTRHATGAGMKFMYDLAHEFSSRGHAIVSGMAMGCDTAAHRGALAAAGDANTIAVLAGGVDYIWPLENERLYHEIIERGCVVSELPVGIKPVTNNFIQRNRWIAGLSEKLIIGEADEKSGSMATAQFAIEYNRPVFAIPGHPSDSRSVGPNRLIKEGRATLCDGMGDFFEVTRQNKTTNHKSEIINNDVLDKLGNIPMAESVLSELVKKSVAEVKRELVMLEIGGYIKNTGSGYVKT